MILAWASPFKDKQNVTSVHKITKSLTPILSTIFRALSCESSQRNATPSGWTFKEDNLAGKGLTI